MLLNAKIGEFNADTLNNHEQISQAGSCVGLEIDDIINYKAGRKSPRLFYAQTDVFHTPMPRPHAETLVKL